MRAAGEDRATAAADGAETDSAISSPAAVDDPSLAAGGPLCSVAGLSKRYGGVQALDDVSLEFYASQVHAVLGENGAGKSTLMKILAGAEQPDRGVVVVGGEERSFASGADANDAGVAIVFQELSLYPDMDVRANLFARREPRRFGLIRSGEMDRQARSVLETIGLSVDLKARVETLPLDKRQLLEIAKALLVEPRVLILDEPTSALTVAETKRLFSLIKQLRARGTAIVFVSHYLEEALEIADVVSVLRDGALVTTLPCEGTSVEQLVTHMIGRPPSELPPRPPLATGGEVALRVEKVSVGRAVHEVSFDVRYGEVVGLAGLENSGIRTLLEAIFGLTRPSDGTITLAGGQRAPRNPTAAVKAGLAYVPPDRRIGGLMLEQSVAENICQITAGVMGSFGPLLSQREMRAVAEQASAQLSIRAASVDAPIHSLSGGNQQKVVIGKWLQTEPKVVLLDDPTRGVDVGAKFEIYGLIRALCERGCAVLFSSSELTEYEHTCNRVLVMRRGRLVREVAGSDISEHALMEAVNVTAPSLDKA